MDISLLPHSLCKIIIAKVGNDARLSCSILFFCNEIIRNHVNNFFFLAVKIGRLGKSPSILSEKQKKIPTAYLKYSIVDHISFSYSFIKCVS